MRQCYRFLTENNTFSETVLRIARTLPQNYWKKTYTKTGPESLKFRQSLAFLSSVTIEREYLHIAFGPLTLLRLKSMVISQKSVATCDVNKQHIPLTLAKIYSLVMRKERTRFVNMVCNVYTKNENCCTNCLRIALGSFPFHSSKAFHWVFSGMSQMGSCWKSLILSKFKWFWISEFPFFIFVPLSFSMK